MDSLLQDIRYAVRRLVKSPGFTLVAVLTLALGIGATTAIFSVVRAVLIEPLPYSESDRVMTLWNSWVGWEKTWLSEPEVMDYRAGTQRTIEEIAAYTTTSANLTGGDFPERVAAAAITANTFATLGVEAALGRTFTAEEDVPGRDQVVLLGHGLWRRRFGGDPAILGQTVQLDGTERTVVGVMPPSFKLPEDFRSGRPSELWVPLALNLDSLESRGSHYLLGLARLRPGVSPAQANAELHAVTQRWVDEGLVPEQARFAAFVVPVQEEVFGTLRPALLILLGAVGFVLLIACANVANLQLARSDARAREIAVRAAIGAGRARIAAQLLTESAVLALLGGLAGIALAFGGLEALVALHPANLPRLDEVHVDRMVLGFTLLVSLAAGVLFGVVPALHASRTDLAPGLRDGSRGATVGRARQRFRRALVVTEVALALVLVIGAGLLIRSFWELQRIDLGFDEANVLTLRMALPQSEYPEAAAAAQFYRELVGRIEALPGVRSAAAVRVLPLSGTIGDWGIQIEGRESGPEDNLHGDWQVVTPGYFETMRLTLLRGRFLEDTDRADALPVVVINQTMAEEYWPGEDPLGRRFRINDESPWFTIVGVVRDVRHNAVVEEPRTEMYHAHEQFPLATEFAPLSMSLVVRTAGDPLALAGPVRAEVRAMNPNLPVSEVRSMEQVVSDAFAQPRFTTFLLVTFAGVALLLAAIGIYGLLSYAVTQRTHEIGIRVALGARRGAVLRLVVQQGMLLSVAGIGLGIGAAFFLTRLLRSLVYGVGTLDPLTFVVVPTALIGVALLASYLPARRATRVDPMIALRSE